MMSTKNEQEMADEWYELKSRIMERMLGKEHDIVRHAIIPHEIGGALDLYYYLNGIPGTAIASKELSLSPNEGCSNNTFDLYELVMFTKHKISLDHSHDESTAFGKIHKRINMILNVVAAYSAQATLNPTETCELPPEVENSEGKCLILDAFGGSSELDSNFGLLTLIEIFRSEMNFARESGGEKLLSRLKKAGHYPYSDLERDPVA